MHILIAGRHSCPYCAKAKALAEAHAPLSHTFVDLTDPQARADFERRYRPFVPLYHRTVPIVFVNGQFVGGASELEAMLVGDDDDDVAPSPAYYGYY